MIIIIFLSFIILFEVYFKKLILFYIEYKLSVSNIVLLIFTFVLTFIEWKRFSRERAAPAIKQGTKSLAKPDLITIEVVIINEGLHLWTASFKLLMPNNISLKGHIAGSKVLLIEKNDL